MDRNHQVSKGILVRCALDRSFASATLRSHRPDILKEDYSATELARNQYDLLQFSLPFCVYTHPDITGDNALGQQTQQTNSRLPQRARRVDGNRHPYFTSRAVYDALG